MFKRVLMALGGAVFTALAACCSQSPSSPAKPAAEKSPTPAAAPAPAANTQTPKVDTPPAAPQQGEKPSTSPPAAAPVPPAPPPAQAKAPAEKPLPLASEDPEHKDWFISVEKAKEIWDKKEVDKKQVIFIDARIFLEFKDAHIRGAMCYSTKYTEGPPQPKARNYLPGSAIVIYCHGDLCTDSIRVGEYFKSLHMDIGPIFIIKEGFPGWKAAYPNLVDSGNEVGFD